MIDGKGEGKHDDKNFFFCSLKKKLHSFPFETQRFCNTTRFFSFLLRFDTARFRKVGESAIRMLSYQTSSFTMGTAACPQCGFLFPLSTDIASQTTQCVHCGHRCAPVVVDREKLFHFAAGDIASALEQVGRSMQSAGPSKDEQMNKDNRVIEEAFCEKCGTHRPCRSFARQTRSADEGQTIFFQCTTCNSEWSHNS